MTIKLDSIFRVYHHKECVATGDRAVAPFCNLKHVDHSPYGGVSYILVA